MQYLHVDFTSLEVNTTPPDGSTNDLPYEEWLLTFGLELLRSKKEVNTSTQAYYEVLEQNASTQEMITQLELDFDPSVLSPSAQEYGLSIFGVDIDCDKPQYDIVPKALLESAYEKNGNVTERLCANGFGREYCVVAHILTRRQVVNCSTCPIGTFKCTDGSCIRPGACCTDRQPCRTPYGNVSCISRGEVCPRTECNGTVHKCNETLLSGGVGTTELKVDLVKAKGTFPVKYRMNPDHDHLYITYEGKRIFDTGGLFAGVGDFNVTYSGSSSVISVTIYAQNEGTKWNVSIGCPFDVPQSGAGCRLLVPRNPPAHDIKSLDIDGTIVVLGDPTNRAAYVFSLKSNLEWTQDKVLRAEGGKLEEAFGSAVAVHDGIVVVGAPTGERCCVCVRQREW
jgi:hypothetical protein